jgi:hypothetical protein
MTCNQTLCFAEVHRFLAGLFDGDLQVLSRMMWKLGAAASPVERLSGQAARSMH